MVGDSMRFLRMYLSSLAAWMPIAILIALFLLMAECDPDIGSRY